MRVAAIALAIACACESKRAPAPASTGSAVVPDAALPAIAPAAAKLPGALWFVEEVGHEKTLVRLAAGARAIVRHPNGDVFPSAWHLPDGRVVAIISRGDGGPEAEQLALVAGDGTVDGIGPKASQVRDPTVDVAGAWIAFAAFIDSHSELYRIELPALGTMRLTDNPQGNFRPAALGDAIVFVSSRDGDSEIYRMPVAGGAAQRLTAFHRDDWQPVPSPDGKTIAFLSDREGSPRIFLMAPDGTKLRRLTRRADPDRAENEPAWSPDGRSVAYLVERGAEATLWLQDLATGDERVLTPPGARDTEFAISPDGAWIAVSRTFDRATELWAIPLGAGQPLQITRSPGVAERLPRWH